MKTVMQASTEKRGGGGGSMGRRSVGDNEEFSCNIVEEDKSEGFDSMTPKSGREEEEVTRVVRCKIEVASEGGKEMKIIVEVGGKEKRLGKGVKGCMRENKGVVEMWERGGWKAMPKEELSLTLDEGEFIIAMMVGGAVEVIVDSESASERGSSDGTIIKMYITGDGFRGDTKIGVGPRSVREGGDRGGGVGRVIVEANAAFISSNAKFVDDGHVSRDGEILLDDGVEGGRS